MRISSHMKQAFDPSSRGGHILQNMDRQFFAGNPDGLWLEWSPQRIVPKHDGYHIQRIKGGKWQIRLSVIGEPRYTIRFGPASEAVIASVRSFFHRELGVPAKPKILKGATMMKKPEQTMPSLIASAEGAPATPPVQPPKKAKGEQNPLRVNAANADLVLLAMHVIIEREHLPKRFGWYRIQQFSRKILEEIGADPETTNRTNTIISLGRMLNWMEKRGLIVYQRKGTSRSIRVQFPEKDNAAVPPPAKPEKVETPSLIRLEPSLEVEDLAKTLKGLPHLSFKSLKALVSADPELREILTELLQ